MLEIYGVALEVAGELKPVMQEIGESDADLARQMRRAVCSVILNMGEGMGSSGGNRRLRYRTALGSMQETMACVDVAEKLGYVGELDALLRDRMRKVIGTLVNLTVKKRA